MRRGRLLAAAATLVLAGCFTTASDFSDDAESFIRGDDDLHSELGVGGFETVMCATPENQDVGTRFGCTATDDEGLAWEFEVELLDDEGYVVRVSRAP